MPTKRELEARTKSIQKIQQIVRTMELIATNRLRKVKVKALRGRPYFEKIDEILRSISERAKQTYHPLLEKKDQVKNICLVCFTSDRGLCGGFNNTILGKTKDFIESKKDIDTKIIVIGRKGKYYFKRRDYNVVESFEGLENNKELPCAEKISNLIINLYKKEEIDQVFLIFNKFKQQLVGQVSLKKLLPFRLPEAKEKKKNLTEHLYEPDCYKILDKLIPQYIMNQIYQGALESRAQEEMARMLAMKQATDSADDMLEELTLQYHKLRQEGITKEIIEVVSGYKA
jgi:F-type H+-transporting ATPase subunit gamma